MNTPTEEELIEQARHLGAEIEIGGVLGIGIAIVEALKLVRAAGFDDPVKIVVDVAGLRFSQEIDPRATEAAYLPDEKSVVINAQSDAFVRLGPSVRTRDVKPGIYGPRVVSGHPLAPLLHMFGHGVHHHRAPEVYQHLMQLGKYDQPWRVAELRETPQHFVSETAMDSWMSFVAEVFVARVLGMEISSVVMDHYRRVQGPEPTSM